MCVVLEVGSASSSLKSINNFNMQIKKKKLLLSDLQLTAQRQTLCLLIKLMISSLLKNTYFMNTDALLENNRSY